jgi:hypothetical protein
MDSEEKLTEQIREYEAVAKENKDVDVATLMLSALQKQDQNMVSSSAKRWAYFISIGVPPFGLLFAIKYYFSDELDAKTVAKVCLVLTLVAIFGFILFSKMLFSGSGVSPSQIENIKPSDIYELTQ